mmetsp:Transcript_40030/g.87408  ORF Transcript_40030/g.87408 Transcript_40030/m.87408 type:complete len:320 (-) Transcript_40030:143-1102(-)
MIRSARRLQLRLLKSAALLAGVQPFSAFVAQRSRPLATGPGARFRRQSVPLGLLGVLGACSGTAASASSASSASASNIALPVEDLSLLHKYFGGDARVHDNAPMPQKAPSGGTISALSVQIPALERLASTLRQPGVRAFDLGFGSGVMTAMMLAVAGDDAKVYGVDLPDKVPVATKNLLASGTTGCPFVPFPEESFSLLAGDAFEWLARWEREGLTFDVLYAGCSLDPETDQLRRFLGRLKPGGVAVFNLGKPGRQGMYFVAEGGRVCELLMRVNFMMCVSPSASFVPAHEEPPLDPARLGLWIQQNVARPGNSRDLEL